MISRFQGCISDVIPFPSSGLLLNFPPEVFESLDVLSGRIPFLGVKSMLFLLVASFKTLIYPWRRLIPETILVGTLLFTAV